jgi:hypothetical protein
MINYNQGIHPDTGKLELIKDDIFITPFFTKEFCKELVDVCKFYDDRFKWDPSVDPYPNHELHLTDISRFAFEDYVRHYNSMLCPTLEKEFLMNCVWGFYSPFINRYTMNTQRTSKLHNDTSNISMVIKLNDDYTGGELEFPRQKITNRDIPVGYGLVWPGQVSHPHQVLELTAGTKYSFVSWTWPDMWSDPKGIHLASFTK